MAQEIVTLAAASRDGYTRATQYRCQGSISARFNVTPISPWFCWKCFHLGMIPHCVDRYRLWPRSGWIDANGYWKPLHHGKSDGGSPWRLFKFHCMWITIFNPTRSMPVSFVIVRYKYRYTCESHFTQSVTCVAPGRSVLNSFSSAKVQNRICGMMRLNLSQNPSAEFWPADIHSKINLGWM